MHPAHPTSRLAPAALLTLLALALGAALLTRGQLTMESLAQHHLNLVAWRESHLVAAVVGFVGVSVLAALLSVPGIALVTLAGGYLFGAIAGTALMVTGATVGATGLFLVTRAGLGRGRIERWQDRLQDSRLAGLVTGLRENELKTLFLLRLAPVVPFFLANTLPAAMGVGLRRYLLTTGLGILPGTAVIATVGDGLGEVLASGGTPGTGALAPFLITVPALVLAVVLVVQLLRRS